MTVQVPAALRAPGLEGITVRLQILHVSDCPNVALLEARLAEVIGGRSDIEITRQEIGTPEEAAAAGMTGSPTLLIDGGDPFPATGQQPSVSCRLYRDSAGRVEAAPTLADLRSVLGLECD